MMSRSRAVSLKRSGRRPLLGMIVLNVMVSLSHAFSNPFSVRRLASIPQTGTIVAPQPSRIVLWGKKAKRKGGGGKKGKGKSSGRGQSTKAKTTVVADEKEEAARLAEEARAAEAARLAEEAKLVEEARLAEQARLAEEERLAEKTDTSTEVEEASPKDNSTVEAPRLRRRRRIVRRKVVTDDDKAKEAEKDHSAAKAEVEEEEEPNILKPRRSTSVALPVRDIRQVVGGGKSKAVQPSTSGTTAVQNKFKSLLDGALTKPAEEPTSPVSATGRERSRGVAVSNEQQDALERMLADAKAMQALEGNDEGSSSIDNTVEEDSGIFSFLSSKDEKEAKTVLSQVRNAFSVLVTVDFFVVLGFLGWFLVGIFSSYVLKDDAIQIAFNSNFQQLVQPALGILMIAAIADAVTKPKEDED